MDLMERITEKLKTVIDPETNIDVITMDLIKDLEVLDAGDVKLKFRPTVPTCPLGFRLAFDIQKAIKEIEGIGKVNIEVIDFSRAGELNKMLEESGEKETK